MPRGRQFSEYERGFIHASVKEGKTFEQIAKDLKRSAAGVRQFAQRKSYQRRSGRPSTISERERRLIIRTASNSDLSSETIRQLCNINATSRTVRNVIRQCPYIRRLKLMKKSRLTKYHEQERLKFARNNMDQDWDTVLLKVLLKFINYLFLDNLLGREEVEFGWAGWVPLLLARLEARATLFV